MNALGEADDDDVAMAVVATTEARRQRHHHHHHRHQRHNRRQDSLQIGDARRRAVDDAAAAVDGDDDDDDVEFPPAAAAPGNADSNNNNNDNNNGDDAAAFMLAAAGGGGGGVGEGGDPLPDADAAADAGDDANVVMDVERVPLTGYEWMQTLEPPAATAPDAEGGGGVLVDDQGNPVPPQAEYCYVCNTVPSAEDHALARVTSIFAQTRTMDDRRIVDLVYAIYERTIRNTGRRPRPRWSKASILAHMTTHAPTPEYLVMDAVRMSTALLRPFIMTGRRVDASTGKELPPDDRHTRACLNVLAMRMRAATQLASMMERSAATT